MIRLITYNIHRGEGTDGQLDLERIAAVLRDATPDIVCLQEVDVNQPRSEHLDFPEQFAAMLDMDYAFGDNFHFDGGRYGNATFARFPMHFIDNFPLPVEAEAEPRGCLQVEIATPEGPVQVFNTHLSYNDSPRLIQAETITGKLPQSRALLVGDMNDPDFAPAIQQLKTVVGDSFTPSAEDPGLTFPTEGLRNRIDYVLASQDIRIVHSSPLDTPVTRVASDHLPWQVDFELP